MKTYFSTIILTLLSLNFIFSQKTFFTKKTLENWNFTTQRWEDERSSTDYQVFQNSNGKVSESYFVIKNNFTDVLAERTFKYDERNRLVEQTANYINSRAFADYRTKYTVKFQYTDFDSISVQQEYLLEDKLKKEILLSERRLSYNSQKKVILEQNYGLENGDYTKSLGIKLINQTKFEYDDKGQLKIFESDYERVEYRRNSANFIEEIEQFSKGANNFSYISRTKYDSKNRIIKKQSIWKNNANNLEKINNQTTWGFDDVNNNILQTDYFYIDSLKALLPTYYIFDKLDNKGKLIQRKYSAEKDTTQKLIDAENIYEYYNNDLIKKDIKKYKTGSVNYIDATYSSSYLYDSEKRISEILINEIGTAPNFLFNYRTRHKIEYGEIEANEVNLGEFVLFPNPATNNFKVSNILIQGCAYTIDLVDFNGVTIQEYLPRNNGYGLCEWDCEIPKTIQSGHYLVVINKTDGTKVGKRIWIER